MAEVPTVDEIHSYNKSELKQSCRRLGLQVGGNKDDLLARLEEYINEASNPWEGLPKPNLAMSNVGQFSRAENSQTSGSSLGLLVQPAIAINTHGKVVAHYWEFDYIHGNAPCGRWNPFHQSIATKLDMALARIHATPIMIVNEVPLFGSFTVDLSSNQLSCAPGYLCNIRYQSCSRALVPPKAKENPQNGFFTLCLIVSMREDLRDIDRKLILDAFKKCRGDHTTAMELIVDNETARLTNLAMNASREQFESEEASVRKRQKKETLDSEPTKNPSFSNSIILSSTKGSKKCHEWFDNVDNREPIVELLELEKKCLKWYPGSKNFFLNAGSNFCTLGKGLNWKRDLSLNTKSVLQELKSKVLEKPDCHGVAGGIPAIFANPRKPGSKDASIDDDIIVEAEVKKNSKGELNHDIIVLD
eukprot:m.176489 g.176489  ORF g.176489 m.176489 type:complete len:417 (-) comp15445_c0_seq7:970-2220(-)